MKRCPYCGKQYADAVAICPVDRQPLADPAGKPQRIGDAAGKREPAFNARLISHGIATGSYRIYLWGQDLVFVHTDKEPVSGGVDFIAGWLGPAGALVALAARLWQKKKAATAPAHDVKRGPEDFDRQDENSFSIYVPEVREAALEPASRFAVLEERAGRLDLLVRNGRRVKLELPTVDDVRSVLSLLAPLLKSTLRINVEWDEGERRFRKKRESATIARG